MTDAITEEAPTSENPTYAPPDSVLINTLRGELANANDTRLHLQAQVTWQADLLAGMQEQLQACTEALVEAGLPIPNAIDEEA